MSLIDIKQIKHGPQFLTTVDGAVKKTSIITEPSEVSSDELIPSETYVNAKLNEVAGSRPNVIKLPLSVVGDTPTTEFTLSPIPSDEGPVKLIINGVVYSEDTDFTVNRTTGKVTWSGEFQLTQDVVDNINAVYCASSSSSTPTKQVHIMGMVLAKEGMDDWEDKDNAWSGTWVRIDKDFNTIDFDPEHGTWAGMQEVTTNLEGPNGHFIEIPTTWVKTEKLQSGPYAGRNCWWIADGPADGFHVHPAFIKPDGTPGNLRIGANLAVTASDESGYDNASLTINNESYGINHVFYNDLRESALAYNGNGETGYRAYNIYDHGFLQRMILIENGDPNIQYGTDSDLNGNVYYTKLENDDYDANVMLDEKPADTVFNVANNYRGIKNLFGSFYSICLVDGLTTVGGTYQLLAADGSGQMIETGVSCPDSGVWPANCYVNTVNGVNFGDVFINDGRNSSNSNIADDSVAAKGSFSDYQFIIENRYCFLAFENLYSYSGLFSLNSAPIGDDSYYKDSYQVSYDVQSACWRLVQVV